MFTIATLTVGLLGSCAKINERLDDLEKKVDGLENEEIASIDNQIASINSSISDLKSIRDKVQAMSDPATGLSKRIEDLEAFASDVKKNYATQDWAKTTLVTMEEYEKTCDTVAKIAAKVEGFDSDIKACADSLKRWVNEKFGGYYDIATIDAKLAELQEQVDGVDSLSAELAKTKTEIDTAKAAIRAEYRAVIASAIENSEGKLTKALQDSIDNVNATIGTLTGRVETLETAVAALSGKVDSLENMIQTVTIVPAFSDGSVKVDKDSALYIDCIITPAEAVKTLDTADFTILLNKVLTKAVVLDTVPTGSIKVFSKDAKNGTVSIKAYIKETLAELEDNYSLTAVVNVSNGISNYTTEFVPVTLPVIVSINKHSIVVPSPDSDKDTILIATVKHSTKGVFWTSSNESIATVGEDDGTVTIKAGAIGKDTIVVKTIEGNATDTCFVIVGAFPSEFTVNAQGKKVHISQGNLQATYNGSGYTWGFAANQNSYVGNAAGNKTIAPQTNGAVVDLFGWSTNATYYGINTSTSESDYSGDFVDWGKAMDNGGTWRTLTTAEWQYLFNDARMINRKPSYSNVGSGVFIYPDNYDGEEIGNPGAPDDINSAGIVFLPAAGLRQGSSITLEWYGPIGYYWSSSVCNNEPGAYKAYVVYLQGSRITPDYSDSRKIGSSVRLVTECL